MPVGEVVGRGRVDVCPEGVPALGLDEVPEGKELSFRVLLLVRGADTVDAIAPFRLTLEMDLVAR